MPVMSRKNTRLSCARKQTRSLKSPAHLPQIMLSKSGPLQDGQIKLRVTYLGSCFATSFNLKESASFKIGQKILLSFTIADTH